MLTNPGASCVDAAAPVQGAPVNGFVPAGVFTRPVGGAGETGSSRSPGKTRELLGLTALSAELLVFCASEAVAAVRTKITELISLRKLAPIMKPPVSPYTSLGQLYTTECHGHCGLNEARRITVNITVAMLTGLGLRASRGVSCDYPPQANG
jgi:hypothetical protein